MRNLLWEQYPAVKLDLPELSVSSLFRFRLVRYLLGLRVGLVSGAEVIPVEHSEESASAPADLAAEPEYRLGAFCGVL